MRLSVLSVTSLETKGKNSENHVFPFFGNERNQFCSKESMFDRDKTGKTNEVEIRKTYRKINRKSYMIEQNMKIKKCSKLSELIMFDFFPLR